MILSGEALFVFAIQRTTRKPWVKTLAITASRIDVLLSFLAFLFAIELIRTKTFSSEALAGCLAVFCMHYIVVEGLFKRTLFTRKRPYLGSPSNLHPLGVVYRDSSFPSGHTALIASYSLLLSVYFPELSLILGLLTGLVAWSRMACGMHYPSDVVAGALLGVFHAGFVLHLLSLV